MQNIHAAFSLLTRLGPARIVDNARLAASVPFYPLVGLVVGALCVLPFQIGLAAGQPWVQAWLYMGINLWLTRALHWDGLADLADAWGSGARDERFWSILKDSRTGVFGALALFFCLFGMLALAQAHFASDALMPLLLAPLAGRCACMLLAGLGRARDPDSLGGVIMAGASFPFAAASLGATLVAVGFCAGITAFFTLTAWLSLAIFSLYSLGLRQGGLNGDFLGASVVLAELATLAAMPA